MSGSRPNRWLAWVPVVALLCLSAAAAALTKDDVIRMAKEGQNDQAILGAIHEAHASFDLTADDIADLRAAGLGQAVIDAMIATAPSAGQTAEGGPAASESATYRSAADEAPSPQATPDGSDYDQPPPDEPPPPYPYPVYYPVYPLYYPAYYPVYDPFFPPFYGGFFFSFGFVHVSNLFTIFPCDRAVVVVGNPRVVGRTWTRGGVSTRGSTAVGAGMRVVPRGGTVSGPGAASRFASRPERLAGSVAPAQGAGTRGAPPAPRGSLAPPRAQQGGAGGSAQTFRGSRPAPMPNGMPGRPGDYARPPRPGSPFGASPRGGFAPMPAPRGYAPRSYGAPRSFGSPHGFAAPRPSGGGHFGGGGFGGGHFGGGGGHVHGGHH